MVVHYSLHAFSCTESVYICSCALMLICRICHNEVPLTGWLVQQKFIVSQFWKLEVLDQGVGRVGYF